MEICDFWRRTIFFFFFLFQNDRFKSVSDIRHWNTNSREILKPPWRREWVVVMLIQAIHTAEAYERDCINILS